MTADQATAPVVVPTGNANLTPEDEEHVAALVAISLYLAAAQAPAPEAEAAPAPAGAAAGASDEAEPEPEEEVPPPIVLTTEGVIHTPDDEETAAALIAVSFYLQMKEAQQAHELEEMQRPWRWQATRMLMAQGIIPMRPPRRPTWNNVERLRRGAAGFTGITGL
jgi:hypothetical protein